MKKKHLFALAVVAASAAASAQSALMVFGAVDLGVSYYQTTSKYQNFGVPQSAATPDLKQSQWALSNSGITPSRFGLRGSEDLGGGLAASFWLESSLWADSGIAGRGSMFFDRRSTISLSGAWGELRMGRDYNPTFWNDAHFDPFGVVGVGTNLIAQTLGSRLQSIDLNRGNYARKSNSVGYFLPPNLGGVYGQAMYAFGENVSAAASPTAPSTKPRTGEYLGARLGYAVNGLDIALAHGFSTIADDVNQGARTKLHTTNLGVAYDFKTVKLFGEYSIVKVRTDFDEQGRFPFSTASMPPLDVDAHNFLVGVTVPIGPGLIKASYARVKGRFYRFHSTGRAAMGTGDPRVDKLALGYVHHLSKRSAFYVTAAWMKNRNGAAVPVANVSYTDVQPEYSNTQNSSAPGYRADRGFGFDIGFRHTF